MGSSIVVLQRDPAVAQLLAGGLSSHFRAVQVVGTPREVREDLARNFSEVAVLDVETSQLAEIESLHRDHPSLLMVCTHRIPDEDLWMAALAAGAADVCASHDVDAILASVVRNLGMSHSTAA